MAAWRSLIVPEKVIILAVEDSESDRILLQRAFAREGVSVPVHYVHNGSAAIDYLQGAGECQDRQAYPLPSLILLDLNMPGSDGFVVLEWLRARPGLRLEVMVVVFSSSADPLVMRRATRLGADIYLQKGQGPDELVGMVRRLKQLIEKTG